MRSKMAVVPCSGIGKSLGAAAREAAYALTEDLRPEKTKVVALSLLVMGDEEARREVEGGEAIAIDGCKLEVRGQGPGLLRRVRDSQDRHLRSYPGAIAASSPKASATSTRMD